MANLTIEKLKSCIEGLALHPEDELLRQRYCEHLTAVHERVIGTATRLFKKDFYLKCATQIHRMRPINYQELFDLAASVVQGEEAFKAAVLQGNLPDLSFRPFMEVYTAFSHRFFVNIRQQQGDLPLFFAQQNSISVSWFQAVMDELQTRDPMFLEKFRDSDSGSFLTLFQTAIFQWVKLPKDRMPEIFQSYETQFCNMRFQYGGLTDRQRTDLLCRLSGLDLPSSTLESPDLQLFRAIGRLSAEIQKSSRRDCTLLLHTLSLQNTITVQVG